MSAGMMVCSPRRVLGFHADERIWSVPPRVDATHPSYLGRQNLNRHVYLSYFYEYSRKEDVSLPTAIQAETSPAAFYTEEGSYAFRCL